MKWTKRINGKCYLYVQKLVARSAKIFPDELPKMQYFRSKSSICLEWAAHSSKSQSQNPSLWWGIPKSQVKNSQIPIPKSQTKDNKSQKSQEIPALRCKIPHPRIRLCPSLLWSDFGLGKLHYLWDGEVSV